MKKFTLLIVAIFSVIVCQAQILWKISGNGLSKDSYLMGTHHVAPVSILDSINGFEDALRSCDAVYGEIEQSQMSSPEAQQKIMSKAMAPADSTLSVLYTTEQFDSINSYLKELTGGMATLEQMSMLKPATINIQLSLMQTMKAFPEFNPQQQLDITVQTKAAALGKALNGFETVDFQIGLLYGDPIAKQAEDLLKTVRLKDKSAEYAHKLAKAYVSQDMDSLLEIMQDKDMGFDEEARKRMVDDRNAEWVKALEKLMPNQSIFVCVGAGHLPGENGLINQLRKSGYAVSAVK